MRSFRFTISTCCLLMDRPINGSFMSLLGDVRSRWIPLQENGRFREWTILSTERTQDGLETEQSQMNERLRRPWRSQAFLGNTDNFPGDRSQPIPLKPTKYPNGFHPVILGPVDSESVGRLVLQPQLGWLCGM